MRLGISICCVLTAFVAGCFGPGNLSPSQLTPTEQAVRVYHKGETPECEHERLGTVEATSGTAVSMGTYESSVAKMQRSAAALGATGVVVMDHSKNQMADQTTGMAIRCKTE